MPSLKPPRGFTLIELIIVVAISAMLSTLAITYSSVGRNAVSLSVAESELSQFIIQAKQLSLSTYKTDASTCGYGVAINIAAQNYSVFAYDPVRALPPCPSVSSIAAIDPAIEEQPYTSGTWHVALSPGVKVEAPNNLVVLFYPPDPTVFLSDDGANFDQTSLNIPLVTIDGKNTATITVNSEGQVSF